MKRYLVPAEEIRREQIVVNSRFIASLAPVFSVDEAKAFIARIKTEFADASHNVPVFLIGHGDSEIAHCTDAGEPSGTAGRPALAVLRGSGLGDVVERVRQSVAAQHGQILDEEFTASVTLTARFPVEDFPAFQSALLELTNGSVQAEIIESQEILMPVK
jgi:putative IMPACT (imprinted ancient) family translation regulator